VSDPRVSVVIPSGRPLRLPHALEALAGQTLPPDEFEVLVVRDGDASSGADAPEGLAVRSLAGAQRANIAVLRNLGWREARAPIVAFTDDDCRPAPDWLERLLTGADEGDELILQGRTEPDPDERHLLHGLARSQTIVGPSDWYQTCNIAYPRSLLERLGGFDEAFGQLGEDTDLGLRAREAGARILYLDDALVWHGVIPRTFAAAIRETRRRDTIPLIVLRHPGQRRALYGRVFWKRSHALFLLAAAGVGMARRFPPSVLAALPYVIANTDTASLTGPRRALRLLGVLGTQALLDAVEVAVTVQSAARHRTLVV
jgi:GT2 family glycosyltransferase